MNKTSFLLLGLLLPFSSFAQHKFKLELKAPAYIYKNILFAPLVIRKGFEEFYHFEIDTTNNITNFGKKLGIGSAFFQIKVQEKNIISGQFAYPQPVSFQYYDPVEKRSVISATFFLDSGYHKIELPANFDSCQLSLNSAINNEYADFKKIFSELYIKTPGRVFDSLTSLTEKGKRVGVYIKKHPTSYVALWEIINDYTKYSFNSIYLENLQLFSDEIKNTELFKKLENKLRSEHSTLIGEEFPTINLGPDHTLTKTDFTKYSLTLIDYWSTTCKPCIASMPKLVSMYNEYKNKGVNFITITDERESQRIALAKSLLKKNNIKWTNYYDVKQDFKNKVNATVYPLYFLIDRNGVIVKRVSGLSDIERAIKEHLK
jgi:thiol-disulfide isomerase/thioredoxin